MQGCETDCSCGSSTKTTAGIWSPAIEELVAIGAAVGCNCVPCVKYHIEKARELGVTGEDLVQAVSIASKVKQHPVKLVLDEADRLLGGEVLRSVDPQASCGAGRGQTAKCCW